MGGDTIKYLTCNSDAFRVTMVDNSPKIVSPYCLLYTEVVSAGLVTDYSTPSAAFGLSSSAQTKHT